MMNTRLQTLLYILVSLLTVIRTHGVSVDITYVPSAVAKGGVCLDGSPPAYYFSKGFGAGIKNWLVHIQGGAWCNNVTTCLVRADTYLGSSKKMLKQVPFSGILSNQRKFNPDFYNWNRIMVAYCDGASFTGDIEAVDPTNKLYFRGAKVFVAVIEDLLDKGMKNAKRALLSGCSAGGLTSILHCDKFKALLPTRAKVKCFADAGYFINVKDVSGAPRIQDFYDDVVKTHGSAKNLPSSCISKGKPGLCFFPQNIARDIRTPLFITNAAYDSWQIRNILVPDEADPHGTWLDCKIDLKNCSPSQLQILQGFRRDFIYALLTGLGIFKPRGYYINSCYTHCQTETQETWYGSHSPVLHKKTIAEAVGDWYYDRSLFPFKEIDCPYPCDRTCGNNSYPYENSPLQICSHSKSHYLE